MAIIAVFDSGLGGLTILSRLLRDYPESQFIYLGDTARTPYGTKTPDTVTAYTKDCIDFLLAHEPDCIVAACNTASALALPRLVGEYGVPLIGTIRPAAEQCVEVSSTRRIGVIATPSTIKSEAYSKVLHELLPDAGVTSVPCPLFVPLVEEGLFDGPIVDLAIERYLLPLREEGIDTLLLGCTHYPLLRASLQEYFGPEVRIVECSEGVSQSLKNILPVAGDVPMEKRARYYVTDALSPFSSIASMFLQDDIQVEVVEL